MLFWSEVYIGMNYKEFTLIRDILESNQIQIKTRVNHLRSRMSDNVILGGNPLVLNSTGMSSENKEYKIMVRKILKRHVFWYQEIDE